MPARHHDPEIENDSVFPAYADYIDGVDVQRVAGEGARSESLQYVLNQKTIYYTNSMPSRSALYARAPDAYQHRDSIETWKANSGPGDGLSVLDLRLPSLHPDMVVLIPPELVHPAPPERRLRGLDTLTAPGPVSSAELTRRKLLNVSQQRQKAAIPSVLSSPHQLLRTHTQHAVTEGSPERRRLPTRQATHSSLLRSSSVTDVDSQIGLLSASRPAIHFRPGSPTPLHAQAALPHTPLQQQLPSSRNYSEPPEVVPVDPQVTTAHVFPIPLIHPGDLVTDPHYAAILAPNREQIDAQLTQWWRIVHEYPDDESRKQALIQIQMASTQVHRMLEPMAPAQALTVHPTTSPQSYDQRAVLQGNPDTENQADQLEYQPYSQRLEQRAHSQQFLEYSQQYQQSDTHDLPPPLDSKGYSNTPPSIPAAVRAHIDAELPRFFAATRFASMSLVDTKGQAEQAKARAYLKEFFSSLPVEAQPYLKHNLEMMWPQHAPSQPVYQPIRNSPTPLNQPYPHPQQQQAVSQVPVVDISHELRAYIDANLPRFFDAIRCAASPDAQLVARQNANEFQTRFKASLPEEGHAYIQEIVERMAVAQREGRDMMSAIG